MQASKFFTARLKIHHDNGGLQIIIYPTYRKDINVKL